LKFIKNIDITISGKLISYVLTDKLVNTTVTLNYCIYHTMMLHLHTYTCIYYLHTYIHLTQICIHTHTHTPRSMYYVTLIVTGDFKFVTKYSNILKIHVYVIGYSKNRCIWSDITIPCRTHLLVYNTMCMT